MKNQAIQKQVQEAIQEHLAIDGNSQSKLGKKSGVSVSHINSMFHGRWENVSDQMLNKMKAFFGLDSWPLIESKNLRAIWDLCEEAQEYSRCMAISDQTGLGKTAALRAYAKKNSNVFYVLCNFFMGRKQFLQQIQQAMGIEEGGSVPDMVAAINEKMNSTHKPLLILDDLGKVNDSNYRFVQFIYDATEFNAGIVVCGTEYLKHYIDTKARKDAMGFRELRRRIGYWLPLQEPSANEVITICHHFGIQDQNAVKYIHKHCKDFGTMRNLITNAVRVATNKGLSINRELLSSLNVGDDDHNQYKA